MKRNPFLVICAITGAFLALPAACSNNDNVNGGEGGAGGVGGVVMGGDGDSTTGGTAGDGDGDGTGGSEFVITCTLQGESCSDDGECCSEYCDPESDTCSCGPVGRTCATGDDCCSGQCNPVTNTCAQILGTPGQEGTPCDNSTECASFNCDDGLCSGTQCTPDGTSCTDDSACCSGTCDGTCQAIENGASCSTSGNPCGDPGDCCSGLCTGGLCAIGASYCVQEADACASDSQCCGGFCNIVEGASLGFCDKVPVGGTRCDNKKSAGEVCGGEDCSVCCSRTCAPYGPSGLFICQPPGGCKPDGELCRTDFDCCGGNADSTIPGAGEAGCLKVNPDDAIGRCKVTGCNPHGGICSKAEIGTTTCEEEPDPLDPKGKPKNENNAPSGEKCCGSNQLPKNQLPCAADALLIPRCDTFLGCAAAGEECGTTGDCCNGEPCVQGTDGVFVCYDGGGTCVDAGGPCTISADCCVGSECLVIAGEATGVCGSPGGGGSSGMGGSTGSGGSSSSGGTGGTPSVCAAYGQSCSDSGDCCSGVPCDPNSKTCRYAPG